MNNKLEKVKFAGTIFMDGTKEQMKQGWPVAIAAYVGLVQGLKYKGSVKQGMNGAVAVLGVISVASGINNVIKNWDRIKTF